MVTRPILPLGATLTPGFARHVAAHYAREVKTEAEAVATELRRQGRTNVAIAYAGTDYDPSSFLYHQRPRSESPEHAKVELAVVSWDAGFQESAWVAVNLFWESGLVATSRDVWAEGG